MSALMRANVLYEEEIKLKTSFSKTNYKSQLTKDTSCNGKFNKLPTFPFLDSFDFLWKYVEDPV